MRCFGARAVPASSAFSAGWFIGVTCAIYASTHICDALVRAPAPRVVHSEQAGILRCLAPSARACTFAML